MWVGSRSSTVGQACEYVLSDTRARRQHSGGANSLPGPTTRGPKLLIISSPLGVRGMSVFPVWVHTVS
jgi:hypothetical protein